MIVMSTKTTPSLVTGITRTCSSRPLSHHHSDTLCPAPYQSLISSCNTRQYQAVLGYLGSPGKFKTSVIRYSYRPVHVAREFPRHARRSRYPLRQPVYLQLLRVVPIVMLALAVHISICVQSYTFCGDDLPRQIIISSIRFVISDDA